MQILNLYLKFPNGDFASAKLKASWPNDLVPIEYGGEMSRLPPELKRQQGGPNLVKHHWRKYAEKIGAEFSSELIGEWPPEDDVK